VGLDLSRSAAAGPPLRGEAPSTDTRIHDHRRSLPGHGRRRHDDGLQRDQWPVAATAPVRGRRSARRRPHRQRQARHRRERFRLLGRLRVVAHPVARHRRVRRLDSRSRGSVSAGRRTRHPRGSESFAGNAARLANDPGVGAQLHRGRSAVWQSLSRDSERCPLEAPLRRRPGHRRTFRHDRSAAHAGNAAPRCRHLATRCRLPRGRRALDAHTARCRRSRAARRPSIRGRHRTPRGLVDAGRGAFGDSRHLATAGSGLPERERRAGNRA
jgi:hypothetical protein